MCQHICYIVVSLTCHSLGYHVYHFCHSFSIMSCPIASNIYQARGIMVILSHVCLNAQIVGFLGQPIIIISNGWLNATCKMQQAVGSLGQPSIIMSSGCLDVGISGTLISTNPNNDIIYLSVGPSS